MKIWRRYSSPSSAGAAAPAEELVAQRPRQPAQHARLDEELAELLGQVGQDVPGQVLADEPAAGPDRGEDPAPLVRGLAARREVEQLEAGRPALGPPGEDGQLVGRDGLAVVVPEQALHLPRPEPQVVRADLDEVAGDAQSAQVDRRRERATRRRSRASAGRTRRTGRARPPRPSPRGRGRRRRRAARVRRARLEGPCRVLDRRPSHRARPAAPAAAPPRGGGPSRPRRRPTIRPGTTRRGPRNPWRTRRGASSCRSPPARSRRRGGGTRSSRGESCSRSRGSAVAGGTRTLAATTVEGEFDPPAAARAGCRSSIPSGNTDPT